MEKKDRNEYTAFKERHSQLEVHFSWGKYVILAVLNQLKKKEQYPRMAYKNVKRTE